MRVLTINTGSSSIKAGLFDITASEERLRLSASGERLGGAGGRLALQDAAGAIVRDQRGLADHGAALRSLFAWLSEPELDVELEAIGHRVVHGGTRFMEPTAVTPAMLDELEKLTPVDPDHLPQAIAGLRLALAAFPELPQVACFDTAFHRHKPAVATIEPLPRALIDEGVVRFGFHGLSYEYVLGALREQAPAEAAGRLVIAHLGNGASMVAVRDGVGVETTMGFSPTGGLVMGTRSGDLDPGVLLYLLRSRGLTADALGDLVNKRAGLLGVSGTSADMRDLLERERDDPNAAQAVELFCYQARKYLGALVAVLGGLDALVFTGGIGEHAAPVRARICAGFGFLGLALDERRNAEHAPVISTPESRVTVRVIPTEEALMIARHTARLVAGAAERGSDVHL